MARWRGKVNKMAKLLGTETTYTYQYSPKSRVMLSGTNLQAVRWKNKEGEFQRGWLTSDNKIMTHEGVRNLLFALDSTSVVTMMDEVSLLDTFDALSRREQLRWLEYLADIDWEAFWNEYYPTILDSDGNERKTSGDPDLQSQMLKEMIGDLGVAMKW